MKKIFAILLSAVLCLALGINAFATTDYTDLETFTKGGTDINSNLPFTDIITPDDMKTYLSSSGDTCYGVSYKISLTTGQFVEITLKSDNQTDDVCLTVYDSAGNKITYANDDGASEICRFKTTADGDYYIIAEKFNGENLTANATITVKKTDYPSLETFAKDGTDISSNLPFTYTITPDDMKTYLSSSGDVYYGVSYKISFAAKKVIKVTLTNTDPTDDIYLTVYDSAGNEITYADDGGASEICYFNAYAGEDYYIIADEYDYDKFTANVIITVEEETDKAGLDFSDVTENKSGTNWSYDYDTTTLTLEDGFEISSELEAIILPDGAKIVVNGKANVKSAETDAIVGGDLDIVINGELNIEAPGKSCDGIYADKVTVTGGKLNIKAEDDGMAIGGLEILNCTVNIETKDDDGIDIGGGDIVITNSTVNVTADDHGFEVSDSDNPGLGNIVITNSTVNVTANDAGLDADGNVNITGSTLNLVSIEADAIDAVGNITLTNCTTNIPGGCEGLESSEDILISGGKLVINVEDVSVRAENFKMENVVYSFTSGNENGYPIFAIVNPFELPGFFVVEDFEKNELHKGTWDVKLLQEGTYEEEAIYTVGAVVTQEGESYIVPAGRIYLYGGFAEESEPEPCNHDFDENGVCKECHVQIITYTDGKPDYSEEETNPNTGANLCGFAAIVGAICGIK